MGRQAVVIAVRFNGRGLRASVGLALTSIALRVTGVRNTVPGQSIGGAVQRLDVCTLQHPQQSPSATELITLVGSRLLSQCPLNIKQTR